MAHESPHQHVQSYADAIEQYRARKDEYYRKGAGSPVPASERDAFPGIPYYPVDEAMVFEGLDLEAYPDAAEAYFEIETTDGRRRLAVRAGRFHFEVDGAGQVLTAYRLTDRDGVLQEDLFVPFGDATTGTETYGAGRYLDVEAEDDGSWTLDFNMAYHPSCVYDPRFSCPITPAENRLRVRVAAGERLAPGDA